MEKTHLWYQNKDGSPKFHRRPFTCTNCRDNPTGGCPLPFRKQRKTRWLKALMAKPLIGIKRLPGRT